MKQLFIIVVLFHDKINKVKAMWGTVNHLKVEINIMKKTGKNEGTRQTISVLSAKWSKFYICYIKYTAESLTHAL